MNTHNYKGMLVRVDCSSEEDKRLELWVSYANFGTMISKIGVLQENGILCLGHNQTAEH